MPEIQLLSKPGGRLRSRPQVGGRAQGSIFKSRLWDSQKERKKERQRGLSMKWKSKDDTTPSATESVETARLLAQRPSVLGGQVAKQRMQIDIIGLSPVDVLRGRKRGTCFC